MVNREDSIFKTDKNIYNFQQFETIRSFVKVIFNDKITLNHTDKDLSAEILNLKKKTKPKKQ